LNSCFLIVSNLKNVLSRSPLLARHIHLYHDLARFWIGGKAFIIRAFRQLMERYLRKLQPGNDADPLWSAIRHNFEDFIYPVHVGRFPSGRSSTPPPSAVDK